MFPVNTAQAFDLIFRKLLLHIGCLLSHFNIANPFQTNTKTIHQYEFDEDGNVSESFTIKSKTASLYFREFLLISIFGNFFSVVLRCASC